MSVSRISSYPFSFTILSKISWLLFSILSFENYIYFPHTVGGILRAHNFIKHLECINFIQTHSLSKLCLCACVINLPGQIWHTYLQERKSRPFRLWRNPRALCPLTMNNNISETESSRQCVICIIQEQTVWETTNKKSLSTDNAKN